jgi:hypothetical protein
MSAMGFYEHQGSWIKRFILNGLVYRFADGLEGPFFRFSLDYGHCFAVRPLHLLQPFMSRKLFTAFKIHAFP